MNAFADGLLTVSEERARARVGIKWTKHSVDVIPSFVADMDFDPAGDSLVMPIGSDNFVRDFLAKYVSKVEKFVVAVREIPVHAHPGEPAVQVANLLLRHCGSSKASHLLRTLPPAVVREAAQRIDDIVLDFVHINTAFSPFVISYCRCS